METRLTLKYSGSAVDSGKMDVYAASANMIAFSEFMVAAVKSAYGEKAEARAEVTGFGRGSFETYLLFTVGGPLATFFTSGTAKTLLETVRESFALWKLLKGDPPAKIERDGESVRVTSNYGQIIVVRAESLNLTLSDKGGESVGRFVGQALAQEGMDSITLSDKDSTLVRVEKQESRYFKLVEMEKSISEFTGEITLFIESAVFRDGNKWRFSDGGTSFMADIEDRDFLKRVEDGERFGKGDVLRVVMKFEQRGYGSRVSSTRTVIRVLEHKNREMQPVLL